MYRIIIADDEEIECRALEMMIRNEFPDMEILPYVQNGIDLVASVKKNHPDIAIIDINMPGLNGLDALEMIRTRNKELKVIISSAYSEFQFAKKAMKLGVSDYILKPLNRETFCETLRKVTQQVSAEAEKRYEENRTKVQIEEINGVVGSEFLSSLMLGEPDEKSFLMMQSAMNYEYKGCILICLKNFELDPAVRKQKIRELKEKVQTELGQFGYCVGKTYKDEICFLLTPGRKIAENEKRKWMEDTSAMILRCGEREGYQKIHLGVSTWQEDPYEMLAGLAECRIAAGSQKQEGVRFYDTGKKKQKPKEKESRELIELLIREMKAGRTEKAKEYVRKSFDLTEYENWEGNSAVIASMGAVFYIESAMIDKLNVAERYNKDRQILWSRAQACRSKEELCQWVCHCLELLTVKNTQAGKKSREYVEKTILYMEKHYMDDISLEQTAEISGISSFYLSRLLKQELNQTFVGILTDIRMTNALLMLFGGKHSVKEIAIQSGYNNITYFYKVFKKYTGMSVGEIREHME